jgi:hypothetical protein
MRGVQTEVRASSRGCFTLEHHELHLRRDSVKMSNGINLYVLFAGML